MRGTLLVSSAGGGCRPSRCPTSYGYNECEYFITAIYNGIVDDWYDAPNITLVWRPELAKCRLTADAEHARGCRHDRGLRGDDPKPDRLARRAARARRGPGRARRRQGRGDDNSPHSSSRHSTTTWRPSGSWSPPARARRRR